MIVVFSDSNSQSGGNAICPRETPQWQKPITNFFNQNSGTISHDNENTSSLNTDDKEIIPVEYCSVELNDSTVHDDAENITAIDDDQKDNVPSVEHYERNAKRKKDQTSSKDEGIDSEEEGIAIKRIKFSNVQTDSDATP